MRTLYVSQQGCYVSLCQEILRVKKGDTTYAEVKLPLIEQLLIFGKSQITTQAIHACLWRNIPIAYLSRMGYCYGKVTSIKKGYRYLSKYQQELNFADRFRVAKAIVQAKLKNSQVLLRRQSRKHESAEVTKVIENLNYYACRAKEANSLEQLMGFEGAGAAEYFSILGQFFSQKDFVFTARTRRPPRNEVNAMLSFGYQVIWNHLLALIELNDL